MARHVSGLSYVERTYSSKDRILLINPPVFETRYQWIRWNQPLDLLKLGSFLKQEVGCEVRLFDFMLPKNEKVDKKSLKSLPKIEVNGVVYSIHHYGKSFDEFNDFVDKKLKNWRPTAIWITSLTSYWWRSITTTVQKIRNKIQDVPIVLYGNYPKLETAHAERNAFADILVTNSIDLKEYGSDFTLYRDMYRPEFCGLDILSPGVISETEEKTKEGVQHFVFFNDDILKDQERVREVLSGVLKLAEKISDISKRPKFHGICGILPQYFDKEMALLMKQAGFKELHFEYQVDGNRELDLDSYLRAHETLQAADYRFQNSELSGFVNIGLPDDEPERLIRHCLNVLEIFGFVIPKPYSPTPGSEDYLKYQDVLEKECIDLLSPHFFPFSRVNDIHPEDYDELYRLTAFLNYPVRQQAFNLFPGTVGYEMFRNSIDKEIWDVAQESVAH